MVGAKTYDDNESDDDSDDDDNKKKQISNRKELQNQNKMVHVLILNVLLNNPIFQLNNYIDTVGLNIDTSDSNNVFNSINHTLIETWIKTTTNKHNKELMLKDNFTKDYHNATKNLFIATAFITINMDNILLNIDYYTEVLRTFIFSTSINSSTENKKSCDCDESDTETDTEDEDENEDEDEDESNDVKDTDKKTDKKTEKSESDTSKTSSKGGKNKNKSKSKNKSKKKKNKKRKFTIKKT